MIRDYFDFSSLVLQKLLTSLSLTHTNTWNMRELLLSRMISIYLIIKEYLSGTFPILCKFQRSDVVPSQLCSGYQEEGVMEGPLEFTKFTDWQDISSFHAFTIFLKTEAKFNLYPKVYMWEKRIFLVF